MPEPEMRVRVTLPIADFNEPFALCPHCKHKWVPAVGGPAYLAIRGIVTALREYSKAANNADVGLGVSVRLKLAPDMESGSH